MTIVQKSMADGFRVNLRVRGRRITADTGECFFAIVADIPQLQNPEGEGIARAQKQVFVTITAEVDAVENPRAVETFTDDCGRQYTVLTYDETVQNSWYWQWTCEAQRQEVQPS